MQHGWERGREEEPAADPASAGPEQAAAEDGEYGLPPQQGQPGLPEDGEYGLPPQQSQPGLPEDSEYGLPLQEPPPEAGGPADDSE